MAYAALVSLIQILDDILHSQPGRLPIPNKKQEIESLLENLNFLHAFLRDSSQDRIQDAQHLETKIRDAAYKAQDLIEYRISEYFTSEEWIPIYFPRRNKFCKELKVVTEEIDSIKHKVIGFLNTWDANDRHQTHSSPPTASSAHASGSDDTIVGCDSDFEKIKERLFTQQDKLQVIPIVGMGGIGKTTLAKRLYHDRCVEERFSLRVWQTVSQNYGERDILLSLLQFMTEHSYENNSQESNDILLDRIHKCLKTRIYLIVMDDVWHTEVWDLVRNIFPDDSNGSRILLTTRLDSVADYVNPPNSSPPHHKVHLLNYAESWNLLRRMVFRRNSCPTALEEVGKRIAKSCKGLPFSIVVMSGLLSILPPALSEWERVAEDASSHLISNDNQWQGMLSLSYDYLPPYLRPVFLYMGAFQEDFEILVSKLVKLWIAEGFLKPITSKSLEEIAEEYLTDLISCNLVLIGDKRSDGSIKTCKIHDLTREFCLIKARAEKLFHFIDTNSPNFPRGIKDSRRLSCRGDILGKVIPEISKASAPVRSLLSGDNHHYDGSGNGSLQVCKLLRVSDLAKVHMPSFPSDILKLVHLRYVSLCCEQEDIRIPQTLPDSLSNLQTLIISQSSNRNLTGNGGPKVYLPKEMWRMSQLRHIHFRKCYFPCPTSDENYSLFLTNLITLSKMSSCSCTDQDLFKRTPSLRKLGIEVEESGGDAPFSLGNVVNLPQLEMLKIIVEPGSNVYIPRDYTLPPKLKKLTLTDTKFRWSDMSIVVSLPNLEELKLINNAFIGLEWNPNDLDQFRKLKSLRIDRTDLQNLKADGNHFPQLQRLILWQCDNLMEFPGRRDIPTLGTIELDDASPSAVAKAKEMLQEQRDFGNEEFIVSIYSMWDDEYRKKKDAGEEAYQRRKEFEDKKRKWRDEERKRREEQRRYSSGIPHQFPSQRHSSMPSSSWNWMHERTNFGGLHGGIGREFDGRSGGGFAPHRDPRCEPSGGDGFAPHRDPRCEPSGGGFAPRCEPRGGGFAPRCVPSGGGIAPHRSGYELGSGSRSEPSGFRRIGPSSYPAAPNLIHSMNVAANIWASGGFNAGFNRGGFGRF